MSEPVVLVLDDLHLLDNRASLDAIEALTRHVANGSQMALSARGGPVLPLAASRARGLVLEIGPDDLRMDEAEAGQLLSAAGLDLPDDRVAELTEQTEGWSAGLYLAALSLRARGHRAKGATTFSGSDRLVSEYLRSELLEHLSADDRRFLTRTAVLERMSGPLCDEVLEESWLRGSSRVARGLQPLSGAAGRQRGVVPIPPSLPGAAPFGARQSRAGSRPFAPCSCERDGARRTGSRRRPSRTHRRPATSTGWHGWSSVTVCPPTRRGRVATAERWLDWLEAQGALDRNAAIAVLGALLATVRGRPAQAERWAEAAERATYDGALPDGSPSIDSWLALLRAQLCQRG